jgi:TolB protein
MEAIRAAPGAYRSPRVSPDGKLLAFSIARELGSDLWIFDLHRSAMRRLTVAKGASECPVWTPDGKHIAFISNRDGRWRMYWSRIDGAESATPLTDGSTPIYPASFAPDGKHLCAIALNRKTSADVTILSVDDAESDHPRMGVPTPFVMSPIVENHPAFSPDGHYVAYMSSESGTGEVYVKPFPDNQRRWQISNGNGEKPLWSRAGHRLFYIRHSEAEAKIMVVDYRVEHDVFLAGKPRYWSGQRLSFSDVYRDFDLAPDGRMAVFTEADPAPNKDLGRLDILLNLSDELERRLSGAAR